MVTLRPLPEKRVYLVYEDDAWLRLPREGEQCGNELIRFAIPLVREHGRCDIDERRARLLRERLRQHGLAASRRAEKQDAFGRTE